MTLAPTLAALVRIADVGSMRSGEGPLHARRPYGFRSSDLLPDGTGLAVFKKPLEEARWNDHTTKIGDSVPAIHQVARHQPLWKAPLTGLDGAHR